MTCDQLAETISTLERLLAENGRAGDPFEYQAVCIDKFGVDGHRDLVAAGVTDYIGIMYHGYVTTHVDALCHVWNSDGM